MAAEQRRGSLALGHNLLRAAARIALPDERERIGWVVETLGGTAPRATTFGAVSAALGTAGAEAAEAAEAHAYSVLAGMVAAAVRLRLVSPLDGQAALRRALTATPVESAAGWGFFSPLLDIAAMSHERLEPRLFAS